MIFSSADFIAINKPRGLAIDSGKEMNHATLSSLGIPSTVTNGSSLVAVNRMSAEDSGITVLSRHPIAGIQAREMLRQGKLWKPSYWIVVQGRVKYGIGGVINLPMRNGQPDEKGVASITHWKTLKSSDKFSLIQLQPRTYLDNQLQVHCETCLRTPPVSGLGFHLQRIEGKFPGGYTFDISAPPVGMLEDIIASHEWLS